MTVHDSSGTDDDDLRQAIGARITVIHITEVRLAWRRRLDAALAKQPAEIVPYKLLPPVVDSVMHTVTARLILFNTVEVLALLRSSKSSEQPYILKRTAKVPIPRQQRERLSTLVGHASRKFAEVAIRGGP
jgi:hypothetical protein